MLNQSLVFARPFSKVKVRVQSHEVASAETVSKGKASKGILPLLGMAAVVLPILTTFYGFIDRIVPAYFGGSTHCSIDYCFGSPISIIAANAGVILLLCWCGWRFLKQHQWILAIACGAFWFVQFSDDGAFATERWPFYPAALVLLATSFVWSVVRPKAA